VVKFDVVQKKIGRASAWLTDAETILARPEQEFLAEIKERDVASFYLFLAIQEIIDLASHWVAEENWGPPDDAASTFLILADRRAIDRDLAEEMSSAVGLRNLIAHGYSLVDHSKIQREYKAGIAGLRRFLAAVAEKAGI
jgi:uncharacterized protein YutE (UPF0331/DUF86 family)